MPHLDGLCQNNMTDLKSYYKLNGLYTVHLITGAAGNKEHLDDFLESPQNSFQYLESVIMVMVYYTRIIHIWFGHKREHKVM